MISNIITNKSIKVVHINSHLNGGAGRAVCRIHESLIKNGVDSYILHLDNDNDKLNHRVLSEYDRSFKKPLPKPGFFQKQKNSIKYRFKKYFGIEFKEKREKIEDSFNLMYDSLQCEIATLPFSDCNILDNPMVKDADIIHFHWIARMIDYPTFFRYNDKPVVWTFHDMNPFQGLFHYRGDEYINSPIAAKLNKKTLAIKQKSIRKRRSELIISTPSIWLLKQAKNSKVFKNIQGYSIANPIDDEFFHFVAKPDLKNILGIPEINRVFLFVANAINEPRKGFDLLLAALNKISFTDVTLLVLGKAENIQTENLDIRLLGNISDDNKLMEYYSLADAFIIPSREDNLPNVMLESFACGTPVIGFPIGGIKEHVIDYQTGLLAKDISSDALAECIKQFSLNHHRFNRDWIKNYAKENFGEDVVAHKYIDVYNQILKR